jgi:endonuclease/exonuclease/phosphatase family metal-dependent hydrolase
MKLKFVCLNLWWGGNLFPEIISFLKEQDADIVALQEVYDDHNPALEDRFRSMDVLKGALGYPHQAFAPSHKMDLPQGVFTSGNAVLSKFPIAGGSVIFLSDPTKDIYADTPEDWAVLPRILQHAALDTPAGEVNVFNMHGVWDLDGDNPTPARQTMVERTLKAVDGKPNVLLAGDTNASQGNPVLDDLDQRLASVFGRDLKSTFNMRRKDKPGYAGAAVDHMWVSPNIRILGKDCPDVDISDHLPLVAELEI